MIVPNEEFYPKALGGTYLPISITFLGTYLHTCHHWHLQTYLPVVGYM